MDEVILRQVLSLIDFQGGYIYHSYSDDYVEPVGKHIYTAWIIIIYYISSYDIFLNYDLFNCRYTYCKWIFFYFLGSHTR